MGWSCSQKASHRMDAISAWIFKHGGLNMQNTWKDPKTGQTFFLEISRREHHDGAITGSVNRMTSETHCIKSGSFRIDGDGKGFRGPALLKAIVAYEVTVDRNGASSWPDKFGEPNEDSLWQYVLGYAKGFELGGINAHVSKALGHVPYPNKATVIRLNDGVEVCSWKAAMFQVWNTSSVA